MNESANNLKWAVLIPAYNEELTIRSLLERVLQHKPTQLIVVNDGSTDKTADRLIELPITIIHNRQNLGKGASLWKGFEQAITSGMDAVITMDGDGQHDPDDIPKLLQQYVKNKKTIIMGSRRRNPDSQPLARFFANKFANFWVSWAAGYRISDSQSGFRLYPVSLLKKLGVLEHSQGFVFESEVLIEAAWQNYYSTAIAIEAIYPEQRRASHFKPFRDITDITRMVASRLIEKKMNLAGLYTLLVNAKK